MSPGELGLEIERLPGVLAATVFIDSMRRPMVYLATEPDADTDAIRATTLALLRDQGLLVDPARIHIGAAPVPATAPRPLPPLSLDSLDVHRTENRVECVVRLRGPNRKTDGTASDTDSPAGRARAAARATLSAAEAMDPDLRLGLHGARVSNPFGFDTVSVLVEASVGRLHDDLPGSAIVDRSIEQAAALATLQALRTWTH